MIIISVCKNKLHEYEFVYPITNLYPEAQIYHYKNLQREFETTEPIIICGTSLKDNEFLNDIEAFDWIKTCKAPIIGICAGAQIICKVLWGSLISNLEIGMVEINGKNPLPTKFNAYTLHSKGIEAPSDFEIIAKNNTTQAFRKDNKIGLLFHPEVRNKDFFDKLLHSQKL